MPAHYVYILECADGTFYTGYTTDVERRVREHDDGEGAKYTRGRTPVELLYVESFTSRSAALSREHEIKQLSHREKERLAVDESITKIDVENGTDPGEEEGSRTDDGQA